MKKRFAGILLVMAMAIVMIPATVFGATGSVVTDKAAYELGEPINVTATTAEAGAYVGLYCGNDTESSVWYWVDDYAHVSGDTYNILVDFDEDADGVAEGGGWVKAPVAGAAKVVLKTKAGATIASKDITLTDCTHGQSITAADITTQDRPAVTAVSKAETSWVGIYEGTVTAGTDLSTTAAARSFKPYTYGRSHASVKFPYLSVGTYTAVLFADKDSKVALKVDTFNVAEAGQPKASVKTDKTTYSFGEPIKVTTDFENQEAWVGLYKKGDDTKAQNNSTIWYNIEKAGQQVTITDKAWLDAQRYEFLGNIGNRYNNKPDYWKDGSLKCGTYQIIVYKDSGYENQLASTEIVIDHSWKTTGTTVLTCTTDATKTSQCSVCNETKTEVQTAATGHTGNIPAATCTADQTCVKCGVRMSTKTGHKAGTATCTEAAKCSVCGAETSPATGHKPGTATCTEAAKCSVCGAVCGEATGHVAGPEATCTEAQSCLVCNEVLVAKKDHTYKKVTTAATFTKSGKVEQKCECGDVKTTTVVAKLKSATVKDVVYTGKSLKPAVTVKDTKGKKLVKGTDYTVTYKNNKNVGKATVTIKFKGKYKGTKNLTFKVNPKATAIKKPVAAKKAMTVKWTKVSKEATGYEIMYATQKNFKQGKKTVVVKKAKTTSTKIKKLKSKKTYYVKVRTYKTVGKTKYYSAWSKVQTCKVK